MMAGPLVSIVIPCHDAKSWIADAIKSALAQTYNPKEILVVDDGSIDGSIEIIRSFGDHVHLVLQSRSGAPKARNTGVERASGEFIHFLDADDILFPQCVTRKMEVALKEKADVVYSGGFFFDLEANAGTYESYASSNNGLSGLVTHIISSSLVTTILLCRRDRLLQVGGFNEELENGQEHELLLRLALAGARFAYVPKALSCNRTKHNPDSITSVAQRHPDRLENLFCRFERMVKEAELWVPSVRRAIGRRFHMIGVYYMVIGDRKRAVSMFEKAKEIEPKYINGLSMSRRLLVPILGGYTTETLLRKLQ
jgi:glycosyltransferase involved in cell wall biosynthesis